MSTVTARVESVTIKGQVYAVEPIPPGEDGTAAYVLTKRDGTSYAVIRTHAGLVECDCPDYEARHRGLDCLPCKHGAALVDAGLIDAPRPAMPTANVRAARLAEAPGPVANRRPLISANLTPDGAPLPPPGPGRDEFGVLDWPSERRQAKQEPARAIAGVEAAESSTPCCDPAEPAPCSACARTAPVVPHEDPCPQPAGGFADTLVDAVYRPTAADLAEMHAHHVAAEARELGMIPAEADPADWPSWTDADRWVPVDDRAEDLLTLDELIDHEADRYRKVGTLAGLLIGNHLAGLASAVRLARTNHPAIAMDRIATLERDRAYDRFEALSI
jgi:hypothetical protein